MRTLLFIIVLMIPISIAFAGPGQTHARGTDDPNRPGIGSAMPSVQITTDSTFTRKQRLKFSVRVVNSGTEPLYVYSALFQNLRFAEIVIDIKQRVIEVRFSRMETSPIIPYYFPKAEFWKIEAKQLREFVCVFDHPLSEMRSYQSVDNRTKAERLTPGHWMLRIMIGYGDELNHLKGSLLPPNTSGKEHPINEIVNWQKIAYSNSVTTTITK